MNGIFISYRREDSAFVTGLIHERLAERFGSDAIFTDIDSIPLGVNFKSYIDEQVGKCDIFLVVIGKEWLTLTDDEGRPRLERPKDFVRLEIESALEREIPVIPLLVGDMRIPSTDELPESLKELAHRNGTPIRPKPSFDSDVERLARGIEKHFEIRAKAKEDTKAREEQRKRAEAEHRTVQTEVRHKTTRIAQPFAEAQSEAGEQNTQAETKHRETTRAAGPPPEQGPSDVDLAKVAEPRKVSRRDFLGFEPARASTVWGSWKWVLVGVVVAILVGGVWLYKEQRHVEPVAQVGEGRQTTSAPGAELKSLRGPGESEMSGKSDSDAGRSSDINSMDLVLDRMGGISLQMSPSARAEANEIRRDPSLTEDDKMALVLQLVIADIESQLEQQARLVESLHSSPGPTLDVETMKLKRLIDKRSEMFDILRELIDGNNQTAKSIIDSMGR